MEELRRRVQKDPASIAFAQLAEEYRRAGRFQEAIETCEAGLAHHPGYLSARVTLGRALLEQGELMAAQLELEQVLRAAPENLAALRGIAEIHHRRGDLEEALARYRTALEFARQDPELEHAIEEITRELEPHPAAPTVVDGLSFEEVKDTFLSLESDFAASAAAARAAAPLPADPPGEEPLAFALAAPATVAGIAEPVTAAEPLLAEAIDAPAAVALDAPVVPEPIVLETAAAPEAIVLEATASEPLVPEPIDIVPAALFGASVSIAPAAEPDASVVPAIVHDASVTPAVEPEASAAPAVAPAMMADPAVEPEGAAVGEPLPAVEPVGIPSGVALAGDDLADALLAVAQAASVAAASPFSPEILAAPAPPPPQAIDTAVEVAPVVVPAAPVVAEPPVALAVPATGTSDDAKPQPQIDALESWLNAILADRERRHE